MSRRTINQIINFFPDNGLLSCHFLLSKEESNKIEEVFEQISKESNINFPFKKIDFSKISIKNLQKLKSFEKIIHELNHNSFKFNKTIEFIQLDYIYKNLKNINDSFNITHDKLKLEFYLKIKKDLKQQSLVKEYDLNHFEKVYNTYINESLLLTELDSIESDYSQESDKFYSKIKYEFLFNPDSLDSILKNSNGEIYLPEIAGKDICAYDFLTKELFFKFCENLNINVSKQKNNWTNIIKPNDSLGTLFNLDKNEALFFAISTKEIPSFKLSLNQEINSKFNITYKVISNQQSDSSEATIFTYLENNPYKLSTPIYFSFQKLRLIDNHSSKTIQIK